MHRLGFIHIPGSAGTALGDALGRSLGCRYLPVHQVLDEDESESVETFSLRVPTTQGSLTREILLSYPLFGGHLSVGQIQRTNRTHIILTVSEPRRRLIRLFAHHADPSITLVDWLRNRIDFKSEIVSQLLLGTAIPSRAPWSQQHAISHRPPVQPNWEYNPRFVSRVVEPIDLLYFSNDPQFVVDNLHTSAVIPQRVMCKTLNEREKHRKITWGDTSTALDVLRHVTSNDYRFIDQLLPQANVDPAFELLSDEAVGKLLRETIELTDQAMGRTTTT